tara:strand:- start:40 stop:441 length:402 start_codon:yes stop_codon:yes gene_type:complete
MRDNLKKIIFIFTFLVCSVTYFFHTEVLYAYESDDSVLIKKVSQSYTKKFCNAIGFGLSKDSAMTFSLEENKKVFEKRKGIDNINEDKLAEEIAISVIEKCGLPLRLYGEKGIQDFRKYYQSKYEDTLPENRK